MMELRCSHYRRGYFGQKPCKSNLRHRNAFVLRKFHHSVNNHAILPGGIVIFQPCITVLLQTLRGFTGEPRKPASGQRTVRRHGDIVLPAEFCHFPFFFPENQIVVPLYGYKLCKSFIFRQCICLCKLISKTVRNTNIADFSSFYHVIQTFHNVIERRFIIPHVINI